MTKIKWLDFELEVLEESANDIEAVAKDNADPVAKAAEMIVARTLRRTAETRRALLNEGLIKPEPMVEITE